MMIQDGEPNQLGSGLEVELVPDVGGMHGDGLGAQIRELVPRPDRARRYKVLECAAGTGRRVVPGAEMSQDLLDDAPVVDDGDDAHWILADGKAQRVHVPNGVRFSREEAQKTPNQQTELGGLAGSLPQLQ
jgi:hypothetical protein